MKSPSGVDGSGASAAWAVAGVVGLLALAVGLSAARPDQTRAYSYGAGDPGFAVFDVSNPLQPQEVGSDTTVGQPSDVAVDPAGDVAYVAAPREWAVLDVRDPKAPQVTAHNATGTGQATRVRMAAGRLLVVVLDPRAQSSTVLVLDPTKPLTPQEVGRVPVGAPVTDVDAKGNALYVATGSMLVAYDISNPADPQLVARVVRKALAVAVDGNLAYVLEAAGLAVIDVTEPLAPREVGYTDLPTGTASSVDALRGVGCADACSRAIVGATQGATGGGGGIIVVDAQEPTKPTVVGATGQGLSVSRLTTGRGVIHVATGDTGYVLFRDAPGGLPEQQGRVERPVDAVVPAPSAAQPTATASASATATQGRETATPTATPRETDTPTATVPGRTPTPTASGTTPIPSTGVWESHGADDGPVPLDTVRYVREGPDGRVWIRRRRPDGGPDQVVESTGQRVTIHKTIRSAVETRYSAVIADGTIPDLWSVDANKHVWVGPAYYDGHDWHDLAVDEVQPGGQLRHEERALLDSTGRAWVPFDAVISCPDPVGCRRVGLRVFGSDALERELPVEVVPEAAGLGVADVTLVPGQGHSVLARAVAAPAQGDTSDYVVGQRALIVAPDGTDVAYPFLEASDGAEQNAGYATSAALRPDGLLQVFTWLEDHAARPDLAWKIYANTWNGHAWDVWDLTPECPLAHDGNEEFLRVTAAAYGPDDTLWVGSSLGEVATWRAGVWLDHFTPQNSPLLDGRPVTDIMITQLGSAWVVQPGQILTYGAPGTLKPVISNFAPHVEAAHH